MSAPSWKAIIFEPKLTNSLKVECGGESHVWGHHSAPTEVVEKDGILITESSEPITFCNNDLASINAWNSVGIYCPCGMKAHRKTNEECGTTDLSRLLVSVLVLHQFRKLEMFSAISLTAVAFDAMFGRMLYFNIPSGIDYEVIRGNRLGASSRFPHRVAYGGLEMRTGSGKIRLFIAAPEGNDNCFRDFAGPAMLHYLTHRSGVEQDYQKALKSLILLNG
jgi:hypothetical protein